MTTKCVCMLCDPNGTTARCSCPTCERCRVCARLSTLAKRHLLCRLHGAPPGEDPVTCPRCVELGWPCLAHVQARAATAPPKSSPAAESPPPTAASTTTATPPLLHPAPTATALAHDARRLVVALAPITQFEARARYGNGLQGWISEGDGSHGDGEILRDRETEALGELLTVESETDARWALAEGARARLLKALLATEIPGDRPDIDRDWEHARAAQRRLRALESHASTAVPAAVLRQLAAAATEQSTLSEIVERLGESFASLALKGRWAADAAPRPKGTPGRPKKDRSRAGAAIGRAALGRELLLWALAAWEGRPFEPPPWVPWEYRPQPEKNAEVES